MFYYDIDSKKYLDLIKKYHNYEFEGNKEKESIFINYLKEFLDDQTFTFDERLVIVFQLLLQVKGGLFLHSGFDS